MATLSKYAGRLAADEKTVKAGQVTLAEAHAKAEVQKKIADLTSRKATLAAAYEQALGANPFKVEVVFGLTREIADNNQNLEIANGILESEFSVA